MKRALCIGLFLVACGGGTPDPKSPTGSGGKGSGTGEKHDSIADLAAAQGGLASLGGAGNREDGGSTGVEVAMGATLHAAEVDKNAAVKLDGVLKEWPARVAAKESLSGKTDGLGLAIAVQYDADKLYVGGEIADSALTRTSKHAEHDDHVSMTLAFPAGRGALKAYEIGFYAGKPGESVGAVKWLAGPNKGESVAGAKIVESDVKGGYQFEAALPWTTFAEARTMRVGLRGAFRYHDGDGSRTSAVIGTGGGSVEKPEALPALPTAPEQAVVDGLLGPKNLAGTAPKIDVYADLTGDERKERISVFGKFFTICGPGYRGGKQFFWREVQGELATFETRELTGRGKDDMVVRRRLVNNGVVHEMLEVWTMGSSSAGGPHGDEPLTAFSQEIAIWETGGKKKVTNAVRISGKEIEVSVEPAVGWDAGTFKEPVASVEEGILLPWGSVKSRLFKLDKGKFAKASEIAQTPTAASAAASGGSSSPATTKDLPTPPVAKASDLGKQVMEAYYRDQGVAAGTKPRFDIEVDVDGDPRPERVSLIGRDIVVLGPGYKGGTGYARMSLTQFADDKDVTELTARDVTGEGHADIIVRGVRHVSTSGGDKLDVEALFIYSARNGTISRIFAVETGREQNGKRIQGLVQFVPSKKGKGFDIDVRPGVARGWTKDSYPWPQDKPGGSIEPLLLPWGGVSGLRYSWNGTQYVAP